jgi:phytoene dehydrogenase-like protein
MTKYDAVIVGSGPNGLAAGIVLQQAGLTTLVLESKQTIGGGMRSAELTLPGYVHDICSAIHPFGVGSPFLSTLPLHEFGLEWVFPEAALAHPFDDGTAVLLKKSIAETAQQFAKGESAYQKLMQPIVENWNQVAPDFLGPLTFPKYPIKFAGFGLKAIQSAHSIAFRYLKDAYSRGYFAGLAGHSILPLHKTVSAGIALVLGALGHKIGWPFPKGGAQQLANAMGNYYQSLGGTLQTNFEVKAMADIPSAQAVLFDITPHQLLQFDGLNFPYLYRKQLENYRYGPGIFKVDWALHAPIPFKTKDCLKAATIHLGGTFEEIAAAEKMPWQGKHAEKPYVLLVHQTPFDTTRAPAGKHTAWAYCHVPNGSTKNMTEQIENQVERFAPGFKDTIAARHTMNTADVHQYNANYQGGDINGGTITLSQLFTRPAIRWSPYTTPVKGIYICSASTPPGGGVHGMCGYHAAQKVLIDL